MAKPHDAGYKLLFSAPEFVRDLIMGFIPDDWLHGLDYATLERVSGHYITEDFQERADDIVWRVQVDGQWVYLYLLIEFQSTVDPWMAVRIMVYVGLLYQDLIRRQEFLPNKQLPPVLPIVLYNGRNTWRAATDIAQLIPALPGRLAQYMPRLEYLLIDQSQYASAQLAQLQNLMAIVMRMERPESAQEIIEIVDLVDQMLQDKPELRRTMAVWIRNLLLRRSKHGMVLPEVQNLQELKMRLDDRFEQWAEEYRQEGLQKGLQQGLQKGEAQLLQRLLARRFGALPLATSAQISAASAADLERWFDRLLDANTLDEIFSA